MRKQDILEAALNLACEKGLGSISMSQIAERVHLKKSSLYSHFRSKDELIECMYEYFRDKAKAERGSTDTDYALLFEGRSFREILTAAVCNYKEVNSRPDLNRFYRLIVSERAYNPAASMIMAEETKRMITATRNLFYALAAKKIVSFHDPDAAALSFAMNVHAIMDYEADAANAQLNDADGVMEQYINEFCRIYESEAQR